MSNTPRTDEWELPDEYEETYAVDSDFVRILERENNELRELVDLITIQEESDNGLLFYPNQITSCRVMDAKRIGEITEKYRSKPHIKQED